LKNRFYLKILSLGSDTARGFSIRRRHVLGGIVALLALVLAASALASIGVVRARAQVATLRGQAERQRRAIRSIDQQTEALRRELLNVQKQNQEIRQLIGAPAPVPSPPKKTSWQRAASLQAVAAHVNALRAASVATLADSEEIRRIALRVLNVEHLRSLAQARMIAAIPSIDPVEGAEIIGCFCYRSSPDAEFHEGVDLGADYGETVRAAAAGIVAANDYDGSYGIKVDIDHGNGYHTWYAHLSHAEVAVGQHVYKGETIGAVGATGFATGPHLHYQIMYQGQPIDPTPFLHGVPSNVLAALP
jgi:murein DD-endopeptidase MepM/ murein hydrolase activator NlpD